MTEIVSRLRGMAADFDRHNELGHRDACRDAADEIEALRSAEILSWDTPNVRPFVEAFAADLRRGKGWGGIHIDSDVEGFRPETAHAIARTAVKHLPLLGSGSAVTPPETGENGSHAAPAGADQ